MKLKILSTETENKTIWILIEAQREKEAILEERRQRHLNALLGNQKSH